MGYFDELNQFAAENPSDAYTSPNSGEYKPNVGMPPQGDPLVAQAAGADYTTNPAPPYGGLTGLPLETAMVTSAQLQALRPPPKRPVRRAPQPPTPFAGLSSYLGV